METGKNSAGRVLDAVLLALSILSFLLMSATFAVMPLIGDDAPAFLRVLPGTVFWGSLLLGAATQVVLAVRRRRWLISHHVRRPRHKRRLGVISFMQNAPGVVADICCGLGAIALAVSLIVTHGRGYACYISLAILVFAFCMHCVFNGKIYYFISNRERLMSVRQRDEGKEERE